MVYFLSEFFLFGHISYTFFLTEVKQKNKKD
nr:MAG TPA: hypothetical protein [Caudoviricetes sp.]